MPPIDADWKWYIESYLNSMIAFGVLALLISGTVYGGYKIGYSIYTNNIYGIIIGFIYCIPMSITMWWANMRKS